MTTRRNILIAAVAAALAPLLKWVPNRKRAIVYRYRAADYRNGIWYDSSGNGNHLVAGKDIYVGPNVVVWWCSPECLSDAEVADLRRQYECA